MIKRIASLYLVLVPFMTALIGFGLGHSRPEVYLPIWIFHCIIMSATIAVTGYNAFASGDRFAREMAAIALFLILPWMIMSVFAGMGAPPRNPKEWVATSAEQEIRYTLLIACGISFAIGLGLLKEKLKAAGDDFFSQLGFVGILIAIPFFILNMSYLGPYLANVLPHFVSTPPDARPDWYLALRARFVPESAVQVSLTYLATFGYACSLKRVGWFSGSCSRVYLAFCILGFVFALLPSSVPDVLAVPSFLVSVPAVTFIMPYLIGIQLLKRAAKK